MSIATKLTTYATQLDKVREQIESLKIKEADIIANIIDLTSGSQTGSKTTPVKTTNKVTKGTSMGDTILNFLNLNPGSNLQTIAAKIKAEAKQAGLSLYHLQKAGKVITQDGGYYVSQSLAAAAKTVPANNDDEEEVSPF